jgi:acetyltransferase-like isoleucine patch superfamily enzyme
MNGREIAKGAARALASIIVFPAVVSYRVRTAILGRDRALEGSTQALSLIPGLLGQYLRRAFLARAIDHCDSTVTVEFGTIFSQAGSRLERNAYVGPGCHLGLVHLEPDVLLAAGVHVPSGGRTHGTSRVSIPIRDQPGERRMIRIGRGSWIGSAAIVLADVGCDTVVAAGSVVTRPLPDRVVAGGVPARVLKHRVEAAADSDERPAPLTFRAARD